MRRRRVNWLVLLLLPGLVLLGTAADGTDALEVAPAFPEPVPAGRLEEITICFTGDNLLGARMPRLIEQYGEAWPYDAVVDVLRDADLAFGNLECPITDHTVRTPGKSWESIQAHQNFVFKAPPEISSRILAASGFDIMTLANNHIMDYCAAGVTDTLAELDGAGISWVGAGHDTGEAFTAKVVTRNGVRIGFIARSKIVPAASKAGADSPGLAWHGTEFSEELAAAIRDLRGRADLVVVTFHWGFEGHRRHAAYQQQLGRQCIDAGANLVIGHHPHCLQGIELYHGGAIAYSLGNFLFTGKSALVESAILRVTASRSGVQRVELLPCWVRGGKPEPAPDDAKLLKLVREICAPCGVQLIDGGDGWLAVEPSA
ncbi:CapA family protein [bacterium]|nr:CapA family protein [bacterium]